MTSVVLCCGQGGVGKTTLSAAYAAGLARAGARVAVITIDPAKRLADALGVHDLPNAPTTIQSFDNGGVLDAMMLDCQATWDELIRRYATDEVFAQQMIQNRYYQAVSRRLPGSHEYMAIEKLYELTETEKWDVVVVDTPPARHLDALLTAPTRIANLFEGRVMRAWTSPSTGWFQATTQRAFQLLERLAGQQVIGEVREFLRLLNELGDGFRARSQTVMQVLTSARCSVYLVTSPDRVDAQSIHSAREHLERRGLRVAGAWMNRVEPRPMVLGDLPNVGPLETDDCPSNWPLWQAALTAHVEALQRAHDRQQETLRETIGDDTLPWWTIPRARRAPGSLEDLLALADALPSHGATAPTTE